MQSIAAIVVTFNRIELLKKCLQSLRDQTIKLDKIIVINNSSTDGTLQWLNSQEDLTIITQENSGSAGGQYTGVKTAYEKGYDWIWCLDTDVVPDDKALEKLLSANVNHDENIGFLSSTIFYPDNSLANINIPYLVNEREIVDNYVNNKELPILSASFGSVLFSQKAVKKVGFPLKEFFIWGDDVEYTFRMIKSGFKGYLVNTSRAVHYSPDNYPNPFIQLAIRDVKMRFGIRNTVALLIYRGELIKNSRYKGLMSSLNFMLDTMTRRIKKNIKNIFDIPYIIFFFSKGIIFFYRTIVKHNKTKQPLV